MAGCSTAKALLPLTAFTFLVWVVSLGGVGSMQYLCVEPALNAGYLAGVRGFSASVTSCPKLFAYYWMHVAFEFAILSGLALALAAGTVSKARLAFAGLLAVATALYIQGADAFLGAVQVRHYAAGYEYYTSMATAAGWVLVSFFNLLLIVVLGVECDAPCGKPAGNEQA